MTIYVCQGVRYRNLTHLRVMTPRTRLKIILSYLEVLMKVLSQVVIGLTTNELNTLRRLRQVNLRIALIRASPTR